MVPTIEPWAPPLYVLCILVRIVGWGGPSSPHPEKCDTPPTATFAVFQFLPLRRGQPGEEGGNKPLAASRLVGAF